MIDDGSVIGYTIIGVFTFWMGSFYWFASRIGKNDEEVLQDSRPDKG